MLLNKLDFNQLSRECFVRNFFFSQCLCLCRRRCFLWYVALNFTLLGCSRPEEASSQWVKRRCKRGSCKPTIVYHWQWGSICNFGPTTIPPPRHQKIQFWSNTQKMLDDELQDQKFPTIWYQLGRRLLSLSWDFRLLTACNGSPSNVWWLTKPTAYHHPFANLNNQSFSLNANNDAIIGTTRQLAQTKTLQDSFKTLSNLKDSL